ncbi:MAG: hypothetical protein OXB88_01980 [Bacteriovoracales bacterium]|nr:hypothetical protein [Bacteriovoracales bacterium]
MKVLQFFQKSPLPQKLVPIGIEEIFLLQEAPCDIWTYEGDILKPLFRKNGPIVKEAGQELIKKGIYQLFIQDDEVGGLQKALGQHLRQMSRTLGTGEATKNTLHQMSLLSTNMGNLYKNPSHDESLILQYRSAGNLINFLSSNKKHIPQLYADFTRQNYHYSTGHPLLSSLLLLSFLKYLNHFNEREVELLVLSNYFKDIGMSLIPIESFDKKDLNQFEKDSIGRHAMHSTDILRGRVPLNSNYLDIIGNHHNHALIDSMEDHHHAPSPHTGQLYGSSQETETILILMMDMITAMISPRPYRPGMSLFEALHKIKILFAKDFKREFHYLIYFLQQFFSRTKQFTR